MEFDENNGIKEREDDYVEIYSKKAIWWFSILASPLFGICGIQKSYVHRIGLCYIVRPCYKYFNK